MKKAPLILVALFLFSLLFFAQHKVVVHKKDGTKVEVNTDEIDSITVEPGTATDDTPTVDPVPSDTTQTDTTHTDPVPDVPTPTNPYKPTSFPVAEKVDLGLPSGTKWASWNIGAQTVYECGGYYGWGDPTGEKVSTDPSSSYHYGSDINGTEYDIVTVKWGKGWSTPTQKQFEELVNPDYTTVRYVTNYNNTGCKGYIITSIKYPDNSIFLPNGGFVDRTNTLQNKDEAGFFWTANYDQTKKFSVRASISNIGVQFGTSAAAAQMSFRGVYYDGTSIPESTDPVTEPDVSPAKLVDLGLPCGTLFADCNLGATKPYDYGGYYSWGADSIQDVYSASTYPYYAQNISQLDSVSKDFLLPMEYDTARKIWGGTWRMPTLTEMQQLVNYCDWTWAESYNGTGVAGWVVKSKSNNNSIFLPMAGYITGSTCYYSGSGESCTGYYWTSSDYTRDHSDTQAYKLMLTRTQHTNTALLRHIGASIRPVKGK